MGGGSDGQAEEPQQPWLAERKSRLGTEAARERICILGRGAAGEDFWSEGVVIPMLNRVMSVISYLLVFFLVLASMYADGKSPRHILGWK